MLLTDRKLRESLGKKGRERVLANFTQKKVAEDTHRVYRDLMSN
jgi:glycosyltransferase involved in cell wall biosynthesis